MSAGVAQVWEAVVPALKRLGLLVVKTIVEVSAAAAIAFVGALALQKFGIVPETLFQLRGSTTTLRGALFAIVFLTGKCWSIPRSEIVPQES
jgi:hypothetical protein